MNKKHLLGYTLTALIALVVGIASAGNATPTATTAAKATPAPTVTVPGPTTTVTKSEVPSVCIDALDAGEKVASVGSTALQNAGKALGTVPDLINALVEMDTDAMEAINAKMTKLNGTLDPEEMTDAVSDYNDRASQCRDAA